jgi:hypothetical protein
VSRELKKDASVTNCGDYEFSADRYLRKEYRQEDIVKFLELERVLQGNVSYLTIFRFPLKIVLTTIHFPSIF